MRGEINNEKKKLGGLVLIAFLVGCSNIETPVPSETGTLAPAELTREEQIVQLQDQIEELKVQIDKNQIEVLREQIYLETYESWYTATVWDNLGNALVMLDLGDFEMVDICFATSHLSTRCRIDLFRDWRIYLRFFANGDTWQLCGT